jgi:hypothetical protein
MPGRVRDRAASPFRPRRDEKGWDLAPPSRPYCSLNARWNESSSGWIM